MSTTLKPTVVAAPSKSPAGATVPSATSKQTPSKMHRRSRSGCFTCRLRRKKCDEGKPGCKACKHLGLKCEYKRPMWWSNNEQRRQQKEQIKNIIKHTKLNEKANSQSAAAFTTTTTTTTGSIHTPPSLCHSLPTSDGHSDGLSRARGGSMESHYSFDFNQLQQPQDPFGAGLMLPPQPFPFTTPFGNFAPYEVDIKTERQMFVNDVPTRRDSTISTFSTFHAPPSTSHELPVENWMHQQFFEQHQSESIEFTEEPLDFHFFDFQHGQLSPGHQSMIQVDEADQHLLNHFIDNVSRLIFPILEANQHGSARADVILPALESNKTYLHCCLSISALHLKTTQGVQDDEQLDADIVRHKFATINELCEALGRDTDHAKILEAALALIFFQCSVGRPDDALPDIAWHQHFQAATNLVTRLDLPAQLLNPAVPHPPFNMTVTAWIDILGATMRGTAPVFADTYREKNVAGTSAGLAELMGCEDRIMFLISEIACLEALKLEGMDQAQLFNHVRMLGEHITLTEPNPAEPIVGNAFSSTGAIRPRQLSKNITAIFRVAARLYLCSLLPDFDPAAPHITHLVSSVADYMDFVPAGPDGFDRSLVWPLLIAGSAALPGSAFRAKFAERAALMGDAAAFGSFGRVRELLGDVWRAVDAGVTGTHWRDVMAAKGGDWLIL